MDSIVTLEVPEIGLLPLARGSHPLAQEQWAFDRMLPELLKTHRDQYVAILDGQVVGSGVDLFAVLTQAYAAHGHRPILCRRVTEQSRGVVHLPSVRVARAG
jgi:hypothetical protein